MGHIIAIRVSIGPRLQMVRHDFLKAISTRDTMLFSLFHTKNLLNNVGGTDRARALDQRFSNPLPCAQYISLKHHGACGGALSLMPPPTLYGRSCSVNQPIHLSQRQT